MDLRLLELANSELGAITRSFGETVAEAAAVALSTQGHLTGVDMELRGLEDRLATVHFDAPSEQQRRCYNDPAEATEFGAYAITFLIIRYCTRYKIATRSWVGNGFDYWLSEEGGPEHSARLEISGTSLPGNKALQDRFRKKCRQLMVSDDMSVMALISIVGFAQPVTLFERKPDQ